MCRTLLEVDLVKTLLVSVLRVL
ncbi:hypothetical protein Goshw_015249 [Gossypium schwendimanii]|uniref:Uncharacterized protein n=1 Tax=Gossypium schwendimanii TaxID=34291 RepID=A0A7J9KSE3_GOSSC|nr:hypothetical protein [Gossypium schwendimanii]